MKSTQRILLWYLFVTLLSPGGVQAQSRIELHSFLSTILGTQMNFNIFLPEGYDQSDERYPVVYLFRGNEREWANPTEDASRRGNIKTVADALYGSGKIGKVILVMPGLSAPATDAEYTCVLNELLPSVDRTFRTLPSRWERGMDGFSLGGRTVLTLMFRQPQAFASAGAYDGTFGYQDTTIQGLSHAADSYWSLARPTEILFHCAVVGGNNSVVTRQVLELFAGHGMQNTFSDLPLSSSAQHNWFFADLHMEQTLPLHWQQFQNAPHNVPVSLTTPPAGSKVSGDMSIFWSIATREAPLNAYLDFSSDRGITWHQLCASTSTDSSIHWKTTGTPDGTRYMLRMRAFGDTLFGIAQSQDRFTIDNPGNGLPDLELHAPRADEVLSGSQQITWFAEDAEGDPLSLSVETSPDNGVTWEQLASQLPNTGSYLWDTRASSNSDQFRLKLRCSDGTGMSEIVSEPFVVANQRPVLADTLLAHIGGTGNGTVVIHVTDPSRITGHRYRISFDQPLSGPKTYSVRDINLNTIVLNHAPVVKGGAEGPLFDGLRLALTDIDSPVVSIDSTRWIAGRSSLIPKVLLPQLNFGSTTIRGTPTASDYLIRVYDHIVDTTSGYLESPEVPVNFAVWNATENHQVDVLFNDMDDNHAISRFDDLIILEHQGSDSTYLSWELFFSGDDNAIMPVPGDVFRLRILKPFTVADVFEFTALPSGIESAEQSGSPEEFQLFQNYPNPFNPATTIVFRIADRGLVRVKIFDLLGREVATIVNEVKLPGRYETTWNAGGSASGMYFCRLESGSSVSVRKMLLLR